MYSVTRVDVPCPRCGYRTRHNAKFVRVSAYIRCDDCDHDFTLDKGSFADVLMVAKTARRDRRAHMKAIRHRLREPIAERTPSSGVGEIIGTLDRLLERLDELMHREDEVAA